MHVVPASQHVGPAQFLPPHWTCLLEQPSSNPCDSVGTTVDAVVGTCVGMGASTGVGTRIHGSGEVGDGVGADAGVGAATAESGLH
mmetsp:Transcript_42218/g.120770  ORF Transcript_42218/g.120770 Transcript_42218/m.120770 type:complete len:86 (-) Transcript_42218:525-782(-)